MTKDMNYGNADTSRRVIYHIQAELERSAGCSIGLYLRCKLFLTRLISPYAVAMTCDTVCNTMHGG